MNENKLATLITRPRQFGKTMTLNMVETFFSPLYQENRKLFEHLSVYQDSELMELQGKIPVISLSFSSLRADSFYDFIVRLSMIIGTLFDTFGFLMEEEILAGSNKQLFRRLSDKGGELPSNIRQPEKFAVHVNRLTFSLQWLSGWLQKYYGTKVLILLDDYDTPLMDAYMHGYCNEATAVIRNLFEASFKSNPHIRKALITGIIQVSKESLFSDFNNVIPYSVLSNGYESTFGFTAEEMDRILKEYHLEGKKEELSRWYGGFTFGRMSGIYNPWSVSSYLDPNNRCPQTYWANTGGISLLEYLVRYGSGQLPVDFQKLLQGQEIIVHPQDQLVFADLDRNDEAVWSLLIAAGYLKPVYHPDGTVGYSLTNHEVQVFLAEKVKNWFVSGSVQYDPEFASAFPADDLQVK